MSTRINPLAGKPAPTSMLIDVDKLVAAYFSERPDPTVPAQRIAFGTSGHRGSAFDVSFNEWHVLAIAQAICDYRKDQGITGPLFLRSAMSAALNFQFRSYYEEVLIVRVHSSILHSEGLPDAAADDSVWHGRYRSIVDLERHLHANGTRIVKVFLHLSKEEQRKRLLARIDEPDKNWKFSAADIAERKFWDAYMQAYGQALGATSTADSPWYIVPADDKDNARLIVSQIMLDALEGLKLSYPVISAARRRELQSIRKQLAK